MVGKWKIYYDDDTTFSSEDGSWEEAPLDGVLVIIQTLGKDEGRFIMGSDIYALVEDTIVEAEAGALLRKSKGNKFGRSTSISRMERVKEQAASDLKKWQIERRSK